jgi:hypothetical protein
MLRPRPSVLSGGGHEGRRRGEASIRKAGERPPCNREADSRNPEGRQQTEPERKRYEQVGVAKGTRKEEPPEAPRLEDGARPREGRPEHGDREA